MINRITKWAGIILTVTLMNPGCSSGQNKEINAEVIIYGGTSAAVTAAIQLARMDRSVVIVCPDKHLGGLSSSGLGYTDTGNKEVIGGLSREFYQRVYTHYQDDAAWIWQKKDAYGNQGQGTPAIDGDKRTMWIFEPHVAEKVFEDLVTEYDVEVYRDHWLDRVTGVEMKDGRILSISMLNGTTFRGTIFIDASYEGDLMASAGVDFHVGRESNSTYDEQWNGVQTNVFHHEHHFGNLQVSPFVVPGDPSSGLVVGVSGKPPGEKGEGDDKVQAYCFRMCLTKVEENREPFEQPENYDPAHYQLLVRTLEKGWRETFRKFDPIPNGKTDVNNHGPFSFDYIGMSYDYPEASYAQRREIIAEHEEYQKGLLYFYANDARVPEEIRAEMQQWGLAKDEFTDNGNWPHQIYVREARRMIGEFVMTENEILGKSAVPRPVGMGSYTMDSHNVQRYVTPDGFVQNEGDIGVHPESPYQIDMGCILPKQEQCNNLLVPVAVSSSHIAFGSIRMEPVFMILGQSAGMMAGMALEEQMELHLLEYSALAGKLKEAGQIID
jgi:hypothetical protein